MAESVLYLIFCGLSCIFLPIYFILIICIVFDRRKGSRFTTTFHNLLISLGIGDLLAMLSFLYMRLARNQFPEYYWLNQSAYWAAPFGYNQVYYWLFIRCFGAALISLQRYITVCQNTTKLCHLVHRLKFWQVFLIHWTPPTVYSLPIVLNSNITYDSMAAFNTNVEPSMLKFATYAGDTFCLVTFLICVISYIRVLQLFRTANMTRSLRKELRITIQVAGPVLAITCAFIYYLLQLYFSSTNNQPLVFFMRGINPIITAFMSYINPVTYLVFSDDLRKLIWNTFCCRKYHLEMSTSKVQKVTRPSTNSNL